MDRLEVLLVSVLFGGFVVSTLFVYEKLMVKPQRQRSKLEKQGIRGPHPSFLLGNIPEMKTIRLNLQSSAPSKAEADHIDHQWPSTMFPHLHQWRAEYGSLSFIYSKSSPLV